MITRTAASLFSIIVVLKVVKRGWEGALWNVAWKRGKTNEVTCDQWNAIVTGAVSSGCKKFPSATESENVSKNTTCTKAMLVFLSFTNRRPKEIISDSAPSVKHGCCFLHIREIGTNVCDQKYAKKKTPPDIDLEPCNSPAKEAS